MTPALGFLAIAVAYAALCAVSPVGACRTCRGFGRKLRESRLTGRIKAGRTCRRCRGTGHRVRTGRWLYNRLTR